MFIVRDGVYMASVEESVKGIWLGTIFHLHGATWVRKQQVGPGAHSIICPMTYQRMQQLMDRDIHTRKTPIRTVLPDSTS